MKECQNFAHFGMTPAGLFAVNQIIVDGYFEFAAARWQHGQGFDVKSEFVQ